jgi:transposase, IS5 family
MKQISLASTGFELSSKRTRKRVFLEDMDRVVPWAELVALIEPHYGRASTGRPPFAIETMLRIHFLQQWFGLSDPAMEEALHDIPLYRQFAGLDAGVERLPDETTILRFRHLLEAHHLAAEMLRVINALLAERGLMLKAGTVVDATLISAPSSTKNRTGQRDPEMHQTRKGNQWYFGMKAHVGVDADSGLVHRFIGTAANVADVTQAHGLLHGQETDVFADAGYQGVDKRPETQDLDVAWHVAMKPGVRSRLDPNSGWHRRLDQLEHLKAGIRARVEHPFRVLKQQFGYTKVRYKGLAKNNAQITTLFALSNLWMARRALMSPG